MGFTLLFFKILNLLTVLISKSKWKYIFSRLVFSYLIFKLFICISYLRGFKLNFESNLNKE
jgi:hypothetical protein